MPLSPDQITEYNKGRSELACSKLCHVPFNHMFFSFEGKVKNCCFGDKHFQLGKYPEQSIGEIWNSQAFKDFRNALNNNELDNGCQLCQSHLNSESYQTVPARRYDYYAEFEGQHSAFPKVMEFELSNLCNLYSKWA